ncbi:putative diguanylate cyclase or phosphodiesterase [Listeria floridensis FSL S10-1187]|uniref:Diguanylate cyclase or phosphodiesterase n=2 Tax=Listeria floridensis TaxID=1494962 RepID=A0ABN0RF04_9LIST|nr:putative diguanylate cyclase or phosphodiesterase [Listeria floridensis FSL S10-1187]
MSIVNNENNWWVLLPFLDCALVWPLVRLILEGRIWKGDEMLFEIFMHALSNVFIVITGCYVISKLIPNTKVLELSLRTKVAIALTSSIVTFSLMFFSIDLPFGILADLRFVVFLLLAYYVGASTTIMATFVTCVLRVFLAGGFSTATFVAISITVSLALILTFMAVKLRRSKIQQLPSLMLLNLVGVTLYTGWLLVYYGAKPFVLTISVIILFTSSLALFIISVIVRDMITTRRLLREEVEYAYKDFLTGLQNVRSFSNRIREIAKDHKIKSLTIFIMDIDFFKQVNDRYGHSAGDVVLKEVARIMKEATGDSEDLFRVGGEEFCLLIPDICSDKAFEIGQKIRKAIQKKGFQVNASKKIGVTISIGIASGEKHKKQLTKLYKLADGALYSAKHSGRNRVVLYDEECA